MYAAAGDVMAKASGFGLRLHMSQARQAEANMFNARMLLARLPAEVFERHIRWVTATMTRPNTMLNSTACRIAANAPPAADQSANATAPDSRR